MPLALAALALSLLAAQEASNELSSLRVHLVDAAGALLVDGWSVRLGSWVGTEIAWSAVAPIDPQSGCAAFEDLRGTSRIIQGLHRAGDVTDREQVALRGATGAALEFAGPAPERSLFVQPSLVGSSSGGALSTRSIVAVGRAGVDLLLAPDAAVPGRWVARDVEPGLYRIEVRDPRFELARPLTCSTGELGAAHLRGTARLVVRFLDPDDGAPVRALWSQVLCSTSTSSNGMTVSIGALRPRAATAGLDYDAPELVPGDSALIQATFDGFLDLEATVAVPEAGASRAVELVLQRAYAAVGAVRDAAGRPVSGVPVLAAVEWTLADVRRAGPAPVRRDGIDIRQPNGTMATRARSPRGGPSREARASESDRDGGFRLGGLAPDQRTVTVRFTPWHQQVVELVPRDPAAARAPWAPVSVVAPGIGAADVRFLGAGDADFARVRIDLQLGDGAWLSGDESLSPIVDDKGRLVLRGLPAGPCRLRVTDRIGAQPRAETFRLAPGLATATESSVDLARFLGR